MLGLASIWPWPFNGTWLFLANERHTTLVNYSSTGPERWYSLNEQQERRHSRVRSPLWKTALLHTCAAKWSDYEENNEQSVFGVACAYTVCARWSPWQQQLMDNWAWARDVTTRAPRWLMGKISILWGHLLWRDHSHDRLGKKFWRMMEM